MRDMRCANVYRPSFSIVKVQWFVSLIRHFSKSPSTTRDVLWIFGAGSVAPDRTARVRMIQARALEVGVRGNIHLLASG
ncbi:hypothetical protein EXIGLDRAFT_363868 [Exidia glandulosa HHB12029]|uniref:Uncharacterized protein n=1 Tax=Exidia glandulosa HHB12029 TaxID=1314781 RepID=A0A165C4I5_EXIGL|nr:hypothetical protein EXIGLDRAFT_363868 [Exidia glandulosa HHB12029]